MIIDLISLKDAKDHLRVTGINADGDIQSKILQASAIILNYLKVDIDASPQSLPWDIDAGVPWDIQAACALIVGELYWQREAGSNNVLSDTIKNLLRRWHTPAMA